MVGTAVSSSASPIAKTEDGPISVRLGELVQAGAAFRSGLAEGVRLPSLGGDAWTLAAARPGGQFTSEPLSLDFPASHVGVHWLTDSGDERGLLVEVRWSRDGGDWSAWQRVRIEGLGREPARADSEAGSEVDDGCDSTCPPAPSEGVENGSSRETFGALVGAGGLATWLQYRLTFAEAGPDAVGVERVALTYLDAQPKLDAESLAGPPADPTPEPRGGIDVGPTEAAAVQTRPSFPEGVISREAWGCDESIRFVNGKERWPRAFVTPKMLVVHHTAGQIDYPDPAAEVRAIYAYHTITRGFGDIGYQLLIDRDGWAYEGRRGREADPTARGTGTLFGTTTAAPREVLSREVVGGHVLGYNYGSLGIALVGLFDEAEPSDAAIDTLEEALVFEAVRHHLEPTTQVDFLRVRTMSDNDALWRDSVSAISGHRDCLTTECPGDRVYARLPEIRRRVAARIGRAGPVARITEGPGNRDLMPGELVFRWEGGDGATEFSTRLEGWRHAADGESIVPSSGYAADQRPAWGPWSPERSASFSLPQGARGSYTFYVRARDAGRREGLYASRWPLYVDRHVLVDNRDARRTERRGDWRRTSETLGFNAADYEEAAPVLAEGTEEVTPSANAATPSLVPTIIVPIATPVAPRGRPASFLWTLEAPEAGTYRVLACWPEAEGRATNARYTVSAGGRQLAEVGVSQRERGSQWVELAKVPLGARAACRVELTNQADGMVVADSVRIVRVG